MAAMRKLILVLLLLAAPAAADERARAEDAMRKVQALRQELR